MSIRQDVYRIGEVVEISGAFTDADGQPMTAGGVKLFIRHPILSDGTLGVLEEIPLTLINGEIGIDITADEVGTWKVRLECTTPSRAVIEKKFEVVESIVLN